MPVTAKFLAFTTDGDVKFSVQQGGGQRALECEAVSSQQRSAFVDASARAVDAVLGKPSRGKGHGWLTGYRPHHPLRQDTRAAAATGMAVPTSAKADREKDAGATAKLYDNAPSATPSSSGLFVSTPGTEEDGSMGSDSDEEYDKLASIADLREFWINRRLKTREDEFTVAKTTTVRVCTWNVNARLPDPDAPLREWMLGNVDISEDLPDVIVVGCEETVELNAAALRVTEQSPQSRAWVELIMQTLGEGEYQLVHSRQFVGVFVCMAVRRERAKESGYLHGVQCKALGVGLMGLMGNKGAITLRFRLHDTWIAVVVSHLAAGDSQTQRRNEDHGEILKRTRFLTQGCSCTGATADSVGMSPMALMEHDIIIWAGDLNYRIGLPKNVVETAIANGELESLYVYDQLREARSRMESFVGFDEPPLTFNPTYKFDKGTHTYDTSDKARCPAWCDRVLYRTLRPNAVTPLSYTSFHDFVSSDHKPVALSMLVDARAVVEQLRATVMAEVMREVDARENSGIPNVTIDETTFRFSNVKFKVPAMRTLLITNIGSVAAQFRFSYRSGALSKPWLSVRPKYGMVVPGETTQIRLRIFVDEHTASSLVADRSPLEDMLVLDIEQGPKFFIEVSGNVMPTAFGSSLVALAATRGPVRTSPVDHRLPAAPVPLVFRRLCDELCNGISTRGLFAAAGPPQEAERLREAIDCGARIPLCSPHAVALVLTELLSSLHTPLITDEARRLLRALPHSSWHVHSSGASTEDETTVRRRVFSVLPFSHYATLMYLSELLRTALQSADRNQLTVSTLVSVFTPILFGGAAGGEGAHVEGDLVTWLLTVPELV